MSTYGVLSSVGVLDTCSSTAIGPLIAAGWSVAEWQTSGTLPIVPWRQFFLAFWINPLQKSGYVVNGMIVDKSILRVEKLTDEFRRLNERSEVRSAAWRTTSLVISAVESWLRDGGVPPGCVLQDFDDGPEPKLAKGDDIISALEKLRRRCREIRADIHRIESAPFSSGHAKQRMCEMIEQLAMQGAPDVSDLIEHDRQITFPTRRVQSDVVGGATAALGFAEVSDAVALVAWLHRETLIKG